jgi:hypothetical protein
MNMFERVFVEPFESFLEKVLEFLPNFLTFLFILVLGIILGILFKAIFAKLLQAFGIDRFFSRVGTVELLRKGGVRDPVSVLFAKFIGWLTIIVFAVISMKALQVPTIEVLFEKFLLYLPNIFVAIIILFVGYLLGNFFGRAALIASVNAGVRFSGMIGNFVKLFVFILAISMALEQLGIGKDTVVIAFAIIFGGAILALAIAFGLGGRDVAKNYIETKLQGEEREKDDISHL